MNLLYKPYLLGINSRKIKSALHCGMTGGRAQSEQTNGFAAIAVFHFGFRLLRAEFLMPQYYIPLAISKDKLHLED